MSKESYEETKNVPSGANVWKNLLNISIFAAEILLLIFAVPPLARFFFPVIVGWIISIM